MNLRTSTFVHGIIIITKERENGNTTTTINRGTTYPINNQREHELTQHTTNESMNILNQQPTRACTYSTNNQRESEHTHTTTNESINILNQQPTRA